MNVRGEGVTIYCHFSFKRPNKGIDGYGLFAVAFYRDFEGKSLMYRITRRIKLWENHQFVTAIQSYEHALRVISDCQGAMRQNNITQVLLVTDNSTLAGWIENPKKNKSYTDYMNRAVANYRVGSPKEIVVSIGLCEVRDYEKSYKYCSERYVEESPITSNKTNESGKRVIAIGGASKYKTISEMLAENDSMPIVEGMTEISRIDGMTFDE